MNTNAQKKSLRNSRVELLRIISMILIVAFHATRMGCIETSQPFYIYFSGIVLGSWGILGVDIFVIISSYFLVDQNFKSQRLINIAFQTFTYLFLYFVLSFILLLNNSHDVLFSTKKILVYFFECFFEPFWSRRYWFVTSYFFMILISPFLNYLICHTDKSCIKKLLFILVFIPIYVQFNRCTVSDIIAFCYIYLLVGYLKKHGESFINHHFKKRYIVGLFFVIIFGKILNYFPVPDFLKIIINKTVAATERHSIILLIIALMICFLVFQKKAFYNPIINKLALCVLGVYLLHEQSLIDFSNTLDFLINKCIDFGFINFGWFFPLQYFAIVLLVYVLATIFEYIRLLIIQKPFMKYISIKFSKQINRIDESLNSLK